MPDGVTIDAVTKAHNDELLQKFGSAGPTGGGWWYTSRGKLKPCPPPAGRFLPGKSGNPSGKGGDPSILNAVKRRMSKYPNEDGEGELAARFADMITRALLEGTDADDLLEFMRLVDMSKIRGDTGRAKRIVLANIGLRKLPPRTIESTSIAGDYVPRNPNGALKNGSHG